MKLYSEAWSLVRRNYNSHRSRAAARGLPFTLTLHQWAELWAPHWEAKDGLMMCRVLDQGGYTPGNVYIGNAADNAKDRMVVAKWNAYWHQWSVKHKPRDVLLD